MTPATPPLTLDVAEWVNGPAVTLEDLRGRVVFIEAFQMLCPGCVTHGLPQAQRVHRSFPSDDVAVIGLHTVFEHHEAMAPHALRVFLAEYRIPFPVGIDRHDGDDPIPATMRHLELRGTPTALLLDRAGRLRHHLFGSVDDLTLGAHLGELVAEHPDPDRAAP